MRLGTDGFVAGRLVEARVARGITASALAEMAQVTRQAISQYENGSHSPGEDVLRRLSGALGLPQHYFLKPIPDRVRSTSFARSMNAATKTARLRADKLLDWVWELVAEIEQFVRLPQVNVPAIDLPANPLQISFAQIEDIAVQVRRAWGIGDGPISNLVWLLENNGFIVSRLPLEASTLDGISVWINGRPVVLINDDVPAARARFDAAHELGHLILHRNVSEKDLNVPATFKFIESQAHRFAAAFCFPMSSFAREAVPIGLERFQELKDRWRVSIKMMIHRAGDLSLASEERLVQLYRQYGWRKWSRREPLDDTLPVERPRLLDKCATLAIETGAISAADLVHRSGFLEHEVRRLASISRPSVEPQNAAVFQFPTRPRP